MRHPPFDSGRDGLELGESALDPRCILDMTGIAENVHHPPRRQFAGILLAGGEGSEGRSDMLDESAQFSEIRSKITGR